MCICYISERVKHQKIMKMDYVIVTDLKQKNGRQFLKEYSYIHRLDILCFLVFFCYSVWHCALSFYVCIDDDAKD